MNFKYILSLALICFTFLAHGQKFGHLNSSALLLELPEVKVANSSLEAFQKQLETDFTTKAENFQVEYQALVEKANSGEFADVQLQQEQQALALKQDQLQKLEQASQQKILQKREELFGPIFKKVEIAVEEVGKENQYTMIFDSSMGFILHGDDSEDISSLVKAKLGL